MKDFRFNYIITIHNKEHLIKDVLNSIIRCCGKNSYIYPVLDGCTDNTEKYIDEIAKAVDVPIEKIYAPDVHEIKSINIALRHVPQNYKGCNVIIQDDVILDDIKIESYIKKTYESIGYSKIGVLAFRHGVNLILDYKNKEIRETDIIESCFGIGMSSKPLLPGFLIERMVGVRSPECISCKVISDIGMMDEKLAPCTFDNHDYSLRCIKKGYKNLIFSIPFISNLEWGGTRSNNQDQFSKILNRNKKYLYKKHFNLIKILNKKSSFKNFIKNQFVVTRFDKEFIKKIKSMFLYKRKKMLGLKLYLFIKFVKMPIKKVFYFIKFKLL